MNEDSLKTTRYFKVCTLIMYIVTFKEGNGDRIVI